MSKDFEDITFLLDNVLDLKTPIEEAPQEVREYLRNWFEHLARVDELQEAILANLPPDNRQKRYEMIMENLKQLS